MRKLEVWRIAALVACILGCVGLTLGACMAKRAGPTGSTTRSTKSAGKLYRKNEPLKEKGSSADAGAAPKRRAPVPDTDEIRPKSRKGMVGSMRLEGGD